MAIRCAKIGVDCTKNDPVDHKAGGPEWLGFDFFVRTQDAEEIMEYISAVLASLNIPEKSIYISSFYNLSETAIWTKERIYETIKKDAEMLIHEASRCYNTNPKKNKL